MTKAIQERRRRGMGGGLTATALVAALVAATGTAVAGGGAAVRLVPPAGSAPVPIFGFAKPAIEVATGAGVGVGGSGGRASGVGNFSISPQVTESDPMPPPARAPRVSVDVDGGGMGGGSNLPPLIPADVVVRATAGSDPRVREWMVRMVAEGQQRRGGGPVPAGRVAATPVPVTGAAAPVTTEISVKGTGVGEVAVPAAVLVPRPPPAEIVNRGGVMPVAADVAAGGDPVPAQVVAAVEMEPAEMVEPKEGDIQGEGVVMLRTTETVAGAEATDQKLATGDDVAEEDINPGMATAEMTMRTDAETKATDREASQETAAVDGEAESGVGRGGDNGVAADDAAAMDAMDGGAVIESDPGLWTVWTMVMGGGLLVAAGGMLAAWTRRRIRGREPGDLAVAVVPAVAAEGDALEDGANDNGVGTEATEFEAPAAMVPTVLVVAAVPRINGAAVRGGDALRRTTDAWARARMAR